MYLSTGFVNFITIVLEAEMKIPFETGFKIQLLLS